jgi:general secretion pathway protein A
MRVRVMYTAHFNLVEPPFALTPNPRYLYMSERHREGLAHLLYGIQQPGGFVQLTGEVGTGKTTLCRCLLEQLPAEVDVALVLNPRLTALEFLATMCDELHVVYPMEHLSVKVLVDALRAYLLDAHSRGRRTVLIVDEAQNLSPDVLEQIRLLTNLETAAEKLLQIILIGQPELIRLLESRGLRQLAQRITARYHLRPFSGQDTCAYIRHRLRVAGCGRELFTGAAMRLVRRLSGGVPRLINVICDRALLGAYAGDRDRVTAATVRRAAREIRGVKSADGRAGRLVWTMGLASVGVAAAGLLVLGLPGSTSLPWGERIAWLVTGNARETPVGRVTSDAPAPREPARAAAPKPESPSQTASAADGRRPPAPRLADILSDPSLGSDDHAAFASLYALWGRAYRKTSTGLGCDAARPEGLECLFRFGNWNRLRRLDLPAILELKGPSGEQRRVTLVALGEEQARLGIGGSEYVYPVAEVERFWDGSFILLWKVPPAGSRLLSRGMRGKDVEWVRARLGALDGEVSGGRSSDVFDADLEQRVIAFQRSRSLVPDGLVGGETLLHLALASREPGVPSLTSQIP